MSPPSLSSSFRRLVSLAVFASIAFGGASAFGQDGEAEVEPREATPNIPRFEGRDRATGPAGRLGATYVLGNRAELRLPAGLPIGHSRVLTFATARQNPRSVAAGFTRVGPALSFDGAIDATATPLTLIIPMRNLSARAGQRLVLAVEQAGLCDATHREHLAAQICSSWELVDAQYDSEAGQLVASLARPGGYRLQFGWAPSPR